MIKIIQVKSKMKEIFSNFVYRMPKDPELILYDFYFLTTYGNDIETNMPEADFAIKEASDEIVENLHAHMLKAVKYALCAEIRHIFDATAIESLKQLVEKNKNIGAFIKMYYKKYLTFTDVGKAPLDFLLDDRSGEADRLRNVLSKETDLRRKCSYRAVTETQKELRITNSELSKIFEYLFLNLVWQSQFGGSAWADIAKSYYMLLKAKRKNEKIIAIDHAYDLQHNTDTVFNKLQLYYKDGYSWIRNALDWKRDVDDIRSFYEKVSPQLRRIVAFIAYNVYGITMEGWLSHSVDQDKIWTGGSWKGGTWTGGTWENGTWEKGIWENGIWAGGTWVSGAWKDGVWESGTWKFGTWTDGTWENGTWENGIWEYGTWKDGTWIYGIWKNGTWLFGTWYDGIWKKGVWIYGTWKNGTWEDGTWKNGTWKDGTWRNGVWKDGTWKNGVWELGTWKDGVWESGIWKYGTWKLGIWELGTWENGIWEDGDWEDGTWKNGIWKGGDWEDGTWKDGIWELGTWKDGVWKSGTWEDGVWKSGTWENGAWTMGTWEDGIWENGTWKEGTWKDGIWKGGGIWNPETKEYEYSNKNPYECEWSLSYRKR